MEASAGVAVAPSSVYDPHPPRWEVPTSYPLLVGYQAFAGVSSVI